MPTLDQFDRREFRSALGMFATGVTIITAAAPDGSRAGVTANSFNSVSLTPPLVLWCLAKESRSVPIFNASGYWGVHVLSAGQVALANRFARSAEDKFAGLELQTGAGQIPLLSGCAARLQCKTLSQFEGGDHIIFVGEVVAFERADVPPLVFHGGNYAIATRKMSLSLSGGAPDPEATFGENFMGYLLARAHFQFYSHIHEAIAREGLDDLEYFILNVLSIRDGTSAPEINARYSYTGHIATVDVLERLRTRGFVRLSTRGNELVCHLTDAGRELTARLIALTQTMESDVLRRFGDHDAEAFRNLLKKFVLQTTPASSEPHP
jgi:3-hydroxy-9,10-secoandrosta-1,3,5(10)-triene-9,17-dione monooxygenase reductase component